MDEFMMQEEFSRLVTVSALPDEGRTVVLQATEAERVGLAKRLDLVALDRLEASVTAAKRRAGAAVRIQFTADVVQSCVVTLEPLRAKIEDCVDLLYRSENTEKSPAAGERREVVVGLDDDDSYEPLTGDTIDLGAAVAEHLALAIDPYRRKPGATLEPAGAEAEAADRPFAALADLYH